MSWGFILEPKLKVQEERGKDPLIVIKDIGKLKYSVFLCQVTFKFRHLYLRP